MGTLISNESTTERNIKFLQKVALIAFVIFFIVLFIFGCIFGANMMPVDGNDQTEYTFEIKEGTPKVTVVKELKEQGLIRNEFFAKLYLKVNSKYKFYAGRYTIKKSMSVMEIYSEIGNTKKALSDGKTVQFVEGKRFTDYAKTISDNFEGISYDDVINKGKDKEYLNKLINKYWFITEDILNDKLYYPLEGYIFADTYEFDKNAKLEDILEKMLDKMQSTLEPYKTDIEESSLGSHGLLTMASVVELEGVSDSDRKVLAGVFYNRLKIGMTLGSDVTTYYATQKPLTDSLWQKDLDDCNAYNTRGTCVKGLPVGPIASPSKSSVEAAIKPDETDYLYFVADNKNKLYFAKDGYGHQKNISDLKAQGIYPE